jgi:hypothetical protein
MMMVPRICTTTFINTPKTRSTAVVPCVLLKLETRGIAGIKVWFQASTTKSPMLERFRDWSTKMIDISGR